MIIGSETPNVFKETLVVMVRPRRYCTASANSWFLRMFLAPRCSSSFEYSNGCDILYAGYSNTILMFSSIFGTVFCLRTFDKLQILNYSSK